MIWTKGADQSAKFQTFDWSSKISPNLYFNRLLKVYKILAKKYRGVMSHDSEDWCKIWRKTDLLFQKGDIQKVRSPKIPEFWHPPLPFFVLVCFRALFEWPQMTRIWLNLTWALETLQNLHFHLFLLCIVFNVWPKKVQRSYLLWHWRVMQNLKKNWLVVWKMTRNFANFHQSTWKCQNWDFDGILLSRVEKLWP